MTTPRVPKELRIALSEPARKMIDGLLHTGLFGFSAEDVCERIICERLRWMGEQGWFEAPAALKQRRGR